MSQALRARSSQCSWGRRADTHQCRQKGEESDRGLHGHPEGPDSRAGQEGVPQGAENGGQAHKKEEKVFMRSHMV